MFEIIGLNENLYILHKVFSVNSAIYLTFLAIAYLVVIKFLKIKKVSSYIPSISLSVIAVILTISTFYTYDSVSIDIPEPFKVEMDYSKNTSLYGVAETTNGVNISDVTILAYTRDSDTYQINNKGFFEKENHFVKPEKKILAVSNAITKIFLVLSVSAVLITNLLVLGLIYLFISKARKKDLYDEFCE